MQLELDLFPESNHPIVHTRCMISTRYRAIFARNKSIYMIKRLLVDGQVVVFHQDYLEEPLNDLQKSLMLIWVKEEAVAIKKARKHENDG